MPISTKTTLEPRKSPIQARSAASVEALLEATVQVLLTVGKERLTTTRVALRAGVSVGTLYQYFPNKSALLQAALRRHLEQVTQAVERVCKQNHGQPLEQMATAVATTFLEAKISNAKASVAFYSVSSDVDGAKIAQQTSARSARAIIAMLATTSDHLTRDPQLVASIFVGTMAGVSRRLLESPAPEKHFEPIKQEFIFLARAYLAAAAQPRSSASPSVPAGTARG